MSGDAKKQFSKLKSAFTKRLKTLFAETLEPLGFTLAPGITNADFTRVAAKSKTFLSTG